MTGAVAGPLPPRTHILSVGIAGVTYYSQQIPTSGNTALNVPHGLVTEMLRAVNAANPITVRIDQLRVPVAYRCAENRAETGRTQCEDPRCGRCYPAEPDGEPFRTTYRALDPDGKLWSESSDPEQVVRDSEGRNCTFQVLRHRIVADGWQPWEPT